VSGADAPSDGFVRGRHAIDAYGAGGFRFAGMSHRGSILATPAGIAAFAPPSVAEINADALAPLFAELAGQPHSIEIVVIGTGAAFVALPAPLRELLKGAGLRIEAMATGPAARVYNVLLAEDRRVAAILLAAP
jgi:uncharacterized protein